MDTTPTPRIRFTIFYYLWVFGLILLVDSLFFHGSQVKQISYSDFISRVTSDQVARVILTSETIYGEMKPSPGAAPTAPTSVGAATTHTPWRLNLDALRQWVSGVERQAQDAEKAREEAAQRSFTVIPLHNPQLIPTLEAHGVDFQGQVESH